MDVAWYVSAQNRTFGPYSHEQMKDFAQDRRLAPDSLVRRGDDGAFVPAESHAALVRFFQPNGMQSGEMVAAPRAAGEERVPAVATVPADGEASNFVLIVNIKALATRDFEGALKSLGPSFRLNAQTWLLQSDRSANAIKLLLGPLVGSQDQMLIIDAGRNRLAWHNTTVFDASRIRDMWRLPHERG